MHPQSSSRTANLEHQSKQGPDPRTAMPDPYVHRLREAQTFLTAALADGWTVDRKSHRHCTLKREGFVLHITRGSRFMCGGCTPYMAGIQLWGPDGLGLAVPKCYDFEQLQRALRICSLCNREVDRVQQAGFRARCCPDCLPEAQNRFADVKWMD